MSDMYEHLRDYPVPKTSQELYQFLYLATGENIPHTKVCADHQTPWDLMTTAFFNEARTILAIGNRKGGKTRSVAKLILCEMFFRHGVEIASVGAIKKQADKCYLYVESFLNYALQPMVIKNTRAKTVLTNHSSYEQLVGTVSGANCLIGDTLIDCPRDLKKYPKGIPIRELVGKEFFTYSYDIERDKFLLKPASMVVRTGEKEPVYKVTYEWYKRGTGERFEDSIIGTAHHPVLLIAGEYKELGSLTKGDRIQPFPIGGNHKVLSVEFYGYEDVYDMRVEDTHNFIANGIVVHNSPHPSKLRADEVELMSNEVLNELMLVPSTDTTRGIPANTVLTSTRKYHSGLVQSILDRPESYMRSLIWCYKEIAQNCPLERRGDGRVKYPIKDYLQMDDSGKPLEIEVEAFSNCGSCPLLPSCRGDLSRANGYMLIDDLVVDYKNVDSQVWTYQMECRRASSAYKVYPQFDPNIHTSTFQYNPNLPIDISVDFGFNDPTAVLFFQDDEENDKIFLLDEIFMSGLSTEKLALEIRNRLRKYGLTPDNIRYGIGDSAQAQQIEDLKGYGIFLEPIKKTMVTVGIDKVRRYLRSGDGKVRLQINLFNAPNTVREAKAYHFKKTPTGFSDDPDTKDDHALDALRYYITYLDKGRFIWENTKVLG